LAITPNWLAMKLDSSGDPIWAQTVSSGLRGTYEGVVEGPDGALFMGGHTQGSVAGSDPLYPVHRDYPTSIVAKFAADGSFIGHTGIAEPLGKGTGNGVGAAWDRIRSITWTPNGPVVCGNKSTEENSSYSMVTAGWVAALTENLGPRWFTQFDGPQYEGFIDVSDAGDGIFILGDIQAQANSNKKGSAAIFHLPYEGMVRFGSALGSFNATYLAPHFNTLPPINRSRTRDLGSSSQNVKATFVVTPFTLTQVEINAPLSEHAASYDRYVDQMNPGPIQSFPEWATYFQLPAEEIEPTMDLDGDQPSIGLEYLTGGNPFGRDANPFSMMQADDMLILEMALGPNVDLSEIIGKRSSDLGLWTQDDVTTSLVEDSEGKRARVETQMGSNPSQFLRIESNLSE
jgi:hypothetical protein